MPGMMVLGVDDDDDDDDDDGDDDDGKTMGQLALTSL